MNRYIAAALCAGLFVTEFLAPAFAQDAGSTVFLDPASTVVSIPYGDWFSASTEFIGWGLALLVTFALRFVPASLAGILKTAQVEQLLAKAIDYGLNAVAGASKDKVLDADLGNAVVAQALRYVVDLGPRWVINFLGGEEGIKARIIARLDLASGVSLAAKGTLMAPPPAASNA
jgi:hypothetical protein